MAWLHLLLKIFGNMCIVIICCPVCDAMNFKINHSFLIKPFLIRTKKSGQKCKLLNNEKRSWHEMKNIFYHSWKAFIGVNKNKFFGRGESNFNAGVIICISIYLGVPEWQSISTFLCSHYWSQKIKLLPKYHQCITVSLSLSVSVCLCTCCTFYYVP